MKKITLIVVVLFCVLFASKVEGQNFEWAVGFGGSSSSIVSDASGNVYTTGSFSGTIDFDPGPGTSNMISNSSSAFITKLDSAGNFLWAKQLGGTSSSTGGYSIATDAYGNIYTTGYFTSTSDFDPGINTVNLVSFGSNDIFVSKLDPLGNFIWAKKMGGISGDVGQSIKIDALGNSYITGTFADSVDFDPSLGIFKMMGGSGSTFICKLDSAGNFVFAKELGNLPGGTVGGASIAVDAFGNIYTTGRFSGSAADFDPGPDTVFLYGTAGLEIFVSKLDPSGNFIWAKNIQSSSDEGFSIIADSNGNTYVTGYFAGTVDFNPGPGIFNLTSIGNGTTKDIFILKLNSSGNFVWAKRIGGTTLALDDIGNSISMDIIGNIYVTGKFQAQVDFDPGVGVYNMSSAGGADAFICKMDSSGSFIWATKMGGNSTDPDVGQQIYIDSHFNLYTTGSFNSTIDFDPGPGTNNLAAIAGLPTIFIQKLSQSYCSGIVLGIDSVSEINCDQLSGYAHSFVNGAHPPYSFQWNTVPVTNDSIVHFSSGGIYSLVLNDAYNCSVQRNLLINHPSFVLTHDLEVNLLSGRFSTGLSTDISLDAYNNGCDSVSGKLSIVLDTLINFNWSTPSPDSIAGDTLIWNFTTLTYGSSHLTPEIFVTTSINSQIGDTVCLNVFIDPVSGDADSSNNHKTYSFAVRNGFDPNIKSVYPTGACPEGYILNNQKLTYTVQFQNTGNANAININVLDSLDTDLDLNSVRVVAHSHPLITEVLPGNVLKFRFDNIQLPDSGANEPLSHGYVIYEVTPKPGLTEGTQIKNDANIYFDFNPAVNTNSVLNTVVSAIPSCNTTLGIMNAESSANSSLKLYPNPTQDFFTIENISSSSTIKLYDFSGRIVLTQKVSSLVNNKCVINTSNLQNGIFLVEVGDEKSGKRSFGRVVVNK